MAHDAAPRGRILIIVNVFDPDRGGGGAIFSDLAYGLAERGYAVTVRCAYPYYPEWTDKSGDNGWRVQRYVKHGVQVERYGLYIPRRPNSLFERLLYEASFFVSLLRALPRGGPHDAVMVYCPLVGAVGYAVLHRWWWRTPLWLNVQDLSADAAAASGIARGAGIVAALRTVQRVLFNRADVWSSISPVMVDRLHTLRRRGQPLLYLPNWLHRSLAEALAALPGKQARAASRPVRLLYAGNIGTKQDLLRFCERLRDSDADFHFRIHGNGGRADDVRAFVEQAHDPRFSFGPFLDEVAFAEALHETDFFVITERADSGGSFIPCKMISGLAAGTPILAVCDADSPLGREMAEAEPGPCFGWHELDQAVVCVAQAAEASGRLNAWQANAARRARFYHRDNVIARFDDALARLIAARGDVAAAQLGEDAH